MEAKFAAKFAAKFENNIALENECNMVWLLCHKTAKFYSSEEDQLYRGDFRWDEKDIDLKYDCYISDGIILEVAQRNGKTWVEELSPESYVGYAKLCMDTIFYWRMDRIKSFTKTHKYARRAEQTTTFTGARFKVFRLTELPTPDFVEFCDFSSFRKSLRKDKLGDTKYERRK